MSTNLYDIVYVIDASLSMGKGTADFRPNKLQSVVEIIAHDAQSRIRSRNSRIGLVAFYGLAIPVLPLTGDISKVLRSLSLISETGEGSAPGDAIIEAAKMLRNSIREKWIVVITDGDLNMGAPLELSIIYSSNNNINNCVITIGGDRDRIGIRKQLDLLVAAGLVKWYHAEIKKDAIKYLKICIG